MKNESSENRIIQVHDFNIGENIRKFRKAAGFKQTEMVAKLQVCGIDISIYSYNRIEKGTQNPSVSFLLTICALLNCDMNMIFDVENAAPPQTKPAHL